jgi:hypothetical protein
MRERCTAWRFLLAISLVVLACVISGAARAEPSNAVAQAMSERYRALSAPPGDSAHFLAALQFGSGLRFNNPYRLATQLGRTGESISVTAPYAMITAGLTLGAPNRLQHGGALSLSFALAGVDQAVLTPSYLLVFRRGGRALGYGRAGPAIVLSPSTNVGAEIAGGAACFITGGLGLAIDVAGNLFYGAGTRDVKYAVYPALSASAGVIIDLEALP